MSRRPPRDVVPPSGDGGRDHARRDDGQAAVILAVGVCLCLLLLTSALLKAFVEAVAAGG